MANPYVKSLFWLVSCGGVGYGLMLLTAPSEEKLAKIRATTSAVYINEDERKKALFLKRMQEAASDPEPIYLKNKKEATK